MSEENGSLLDSIGATLEENYSKASGDEATAPTVAESSEAAPTETDAERAERLRDERGRFAKAPDEQAQEPTADEDAAEPAAEAEGEQAQEPVQAVKAPGSWPAPMREKFAELPPEVQQYINERESGFSRSLNNYTQKAKFADTVGQVMQPYEALIRSDGLEPLGVINGLMSTYQQLRSAAPQQKAMAVAQLINQFGVDLSLLSADGNAGNAPQVDPQLYSELSQLKQELYGLKSAREQEANAQVQSAIESFRANAPHFDAVQAHMGALLANGTAKDLQDAYEQAIWAHPEIRATLLSEQEAKRREDAAKAAAKAKQSAAVNVTRRGIQPPAKPRGSMDDTLNEAWDRMANS